jgi:hypothetical protein
MCELTNNNDENYNSYNTNQYNNFNYNSYTNSNKYYYKIFIKEILIIKL